MLKWLIIFAMYSGVGSPRTLEYRAVATEAECMEIGNRAVRWNREYFADETNGQHVDGEIWAVFYCVDMQKQIEGQK